MINCKHRWQESAHKYIFCYDCGIEYRGLDLVRKLEKENRELKENNWFKYAKKLENKVKRMEKALCDIVERDVPYAELPYQESVDIARECLEGYDLKKGETDE